MVYYECFSKNIDFFLLKSALKNFFRSRFQIIFSWRQISEAHFRSSNSAISFCCLHFGILFADSDGSLMNQVIPMFNVQSKSKSLC